MKNRSSIVIGNFEMHLQAIRLILFEQREYSEHVRIALRLTAGEDSLAPE